MRNLLTFGQSRFETPNWREGIACTKVPARSHMNGDLRDG